jgi:hypothetical protein
VGWWVGVGVVERSQLQMLSSWLLGSYNAVRVQSRTWDLSQELVGGKTEYYDVWIINFISIQALHYLNGKNMRLRSILIQLYSNRWSRPNKTKPGRCVRFSIQYFVFPNKPIVGYISYVLTRRFRFRAKNTRGKVYLRVVVCRFKTWHRKSQPISLSDLTKLTDF